MAKSNILYVYNDTTNNLDSVHQNIFPNMFTLTLESVDLCLRMKLLKLPPKYAFEEIGFWNYFPER